MPETASPLTLVLFDIDGTLLDLHGAGHRAFARALKSVFGWDDEIAYIRFAGATDLDVLRQIFDRRGATLVRAAEEAFFAQLPRELEQTVRDAPVTIYPGVRDLLIRLEDDPRALLGLVTGNIETCAMIKLRRLDLHGHFDLGAFGHEHADRKQIAALALERAQVHAARLGRVIGPRFLIGDTPSDIAAARAIHATSIAVATGGFTADQLLASQPDHAFGNMGDVGQILRAMQL